MVLISLISASSVSNLRLGLQAMDPKSFSLNVELHKNRRLRTTLPRPRQAPGQSSFAKTGLRWFA